MGDAAEVEDLRRRLEASQQSEQKQKEKLQQWKVKMGDIIEKERGELKKLREEKAGWEASCAALTRRADAADAELGRLREASRQAAEMRLSAMDGGDDAAALAEQLAALRSQLTAEQRRSEQTAADFEKYKQQTSTALRLKSRAAAGERDRISGVEGELRAAQKDLEDARRELADREAELRRVRELGAQAAATAATELERREAAAELADRRAEAERYDAVQRCRDEEARLREQYELRLQSQQQLHESELTQLQSQLEEFTGQVRLDSQRRVDALVEENERLKERLSAASEEAADLRRTASQQPQPPRPEPAPGPPPEAEEVAAERARHQRRVWELQQEVLDLRREAGTLNVRAASPAPPETADVSASEQQSYLRAVIVQLLTSDSDDVRASLIPVLAALLRMSQTEVRAIYRHQPALMVAR
eukprot:TRINITY_DN7213_c0_g1_i1.p1 TRINITY_DN7213_c0_g1~~TRINITY_DN7213_c0_g1_i1.p1  ORF type:complete len:440 (+),score=258.09 TRINITY_DN7213_c0_g1_i1:60-1322(+)